MPEVNVDDKNVPNLYLSFLLFLFLFLFLSLFRSNRGVRSWAHRYDARGALHDLAPYEPPPGGYRDRLEGLTAAEQKAEQLCEEERYYSLYRNEVEEEIAQGKMDARCYDKVTISFFLCYRLCHCRGKFKAAAEVGHRDTVRL